MEYLIIDLLSLLPGSSPYQLMRELNAIPSPDIVNALTSGTIDFGLLFYDVRVVNLVARLPEAEQRKLQINLNTVWLPNPMPKLHCQFLIPERTGLIAHIDDHNQRMLNGEPDVEVNHRMIMDPRVLTPNQFMSRKELIIMAEAFYVPRLTEWLPDLTCEEVVSLGFTQNTMNITRLSITRPDIACQDLPFDELEKCFAILPVEQWWDFPNDPCEIKGIWPSILSPTMRCSATCDMRSPYQCLRMAEYHTIFCTWHKSVGVTMHVRASKRSAKDITSSEYSDPQHLELYPQTKRPVSAMTFASNPFAEKPLGFYLPVLRYEGLYYATETKYCGKFYFYEPESSLHLFLGNSRCFGSKVHAYVELCRESGCAKPIFAKGFLTTSRGQFSLDAMTAVGQEALPLSRRLLTTIVESHNLDNYDPGVNCEEFQPPNNFSEAWNNFLLSRYWSVYLSLQDLPAPNEFVIPVMFPTDNPKTSTVYTGEFDVLDQPICLMARDLNIDTLIFQREIGSHDCVTEILDTRVNYQAHLHDLGPIFVRTKEVSKYPKIWFPHDNHLVYVGPNMQRAEMSDEIQRVFRNLYPPRPTPCTEAKNSLQEFLLLIAQDFTMDNAEWSFYDVELSRGVDVITVTYQNEVSNVGRIHTYQTRREAITSTLKRAGSAFRNFDIIVRYVLSNGVDVDEELTSININGTVLTPVTMRIRRNTFFQDRLVMKCQFEVYDRQVVEL